MAIIQASTVLSLAEKVNHVLAFLMCHLRPHLTLEIFCSVVVVNIVKLSSVGSDSPDKVSYASTVPNTLLKQQKYQIQLL